MMMLMILMLACSNAYPQFAIRIDIPDMPLKCEKILCRVNSFLLSAVVDLWMDTQLETPIAEL